MDNSLCIATLFIIVQTQEVQRYNITRLCSMIVVCTCSHYACIITISEVMCPACAFNSGVMYHRVYLLLVVKVYSTMTERPINCTHACSCAQPSILVIIVNKAHACCCAALLSACKINSYK